jgi:choline kinase
MREAAFKSNWHISVVVAGNIAHGIGRAKFHQPLPRRAEFALGRNVHHIAGAGNVVRSVQQDVSPQGIGNFGKMASLALQFPRRNADQTFEMKLAETCRHRQGAKMNIRKMGKGKLQRWPLLTCTPPQGMESRNFRNERTHIPLRVIILAAGQGKRLLPLTADLPKALLDISGKPLLQWQMEAFAACGVTDFIVVTGYAAGLMDETIAALGRKLNVQTSTVFNPFYSVADNLASCWMARGLMSQPFIQVNGDNVFRTDLVEKLLAAKTEIGVAARTKDSYDSDDMKVVLDGDVIKAVGKALPLDAVNGEAVGFYRFGSKGAALYVAELELQMRDPAGLKRWFPATIDSLSSKTRVETIRVDGLQWCEVDFPEDLATARAEVGSWGSA